ncbi:hypothetical protein, partial [Escherichia coli]|uniref:hypothetical protein n=1 Tax=Escherichia coli TaxID=562 RepID=UPI001BB0AF3B
AATMDTLVALGTGVAWLYSMSVNLWPHGFPMDARHLSNEASAHTNGLVKLGTIIDTPPRSRSLQAAGRMSCVKRPHRPRRH